MQIMVHISFAVKSAFPKDLEPMLRIATDGKCMITIFGGGGTRAGWWVGRGSSERCLKWGGEGWGSLSDPILPNLLKTGVGEGKSW